MFLEFVEALSNQVRRTSVPIDLVLLGDTLDLTELVANRDAESALVASIARFDRLATIHTDVFTALGSFVSAGGRLRLVAGNHDLDLAHPALQERFRERLGTEAASKARSPAVTFHSWFFHVPSVVYAEHGHRYHDINATGVPDGTRVPGIHAPADTPPVAYVEAWIRAARHRDAIGVWTSILLARAVAAIAARHDGVANPRPDTGLDPATLAEIDRLQAHPGVGTAMRIGGLVLGTPIRALVRPALSGAVAWLVFRGHERLRRAALSGAAVAGLVTLARAWRRSWPPPRSSAYALEAARNLAAILERAGQRPAALVLAHTHVPTRSSLGTRGSRSWYLNTGSWSPHDALGRYPYVRVWRDTSDEIRSELLWWDGKEP
jgi:UDP-2,3-diacylglucosamine pyrophosphatase LpxH